MAALDRAPVGHVIVAALGLLAIATAAHSRVVAVTPSAGDGQFRTRPREVRPECQRVARMPLIAAAGWSIRNGPLCADARYAMSSVEAYLEARVIGCVDALNGEASSVSRWLSTGADVESAFCIGKLDGATGHRVRQELRFRLRNGR